MERNERKQKEKERKRAIKRDRERDGKKGRKEDFVDVSKLRVLRWRDYPGLSGWALNVIISVLTRERPREI